MPRTLTRTLHTRPLPDGTYEGYVLCTDGHSVHREWTSILRTTQVEALADAGRLSATVARRNAEGRRRKGAPDAG
jgi:hypothetical protein